MDLKLLETKKEMLRFKEVLKGYEPGGNPVSVTYSFIKEYLNPQPDRYDLSYRYEHSLRVALWGKRIAEAEGWDSEPLVIACLLHDLGYLLCDTIEEWSMHPAYGAELARLFLEKISYNSNLIDDICQAILIHDKWNDVPEDATPFVLSVRDADDLDRFDIMRVFMMGRSDIGERCAKELSELCVTREQMLTDWQDRICGTDTAKAFWLEKLKMRRQFYEALREEMQGTLEIEALFQK